MITFQASGPPAALPSLLMDIFFDLLMKILHFLYPPPSVDKRNEVYVMGVTIFKKIQPRGPFFKESFSGIKCYSNDFYKYILG